MKPRHILPLLIFTTSFTLAACGHEHQFTEATCTTPKTCESCGEIEGEPLEHNFTKATCTTPKTCETCGLTEGEPYGHSWTEATTETPKKCLLCGLTEGEPLQSEEQTAEDIEAKRQQLEESGIDSSIFTDAELKILSPTDLAIIAGVVNAEASKTQPSHIEVDDSDMGGHYGSNESTDPDYTLGHSTDPRLQGGRME